MEYQSPASKISTFQLCYSFRFTGPNYELTEHNFFLPIRRISSSSRHHLHFSHERSISNDLATARTESCGSPHCRTQRFTTRGSISFSTLGSHLYLVRIYCTISTWKAQTEEVEVTRKPRKGTSLENERDERDEWDEWPGRRERIKGKEWNGQQSPVEYDFGLVRCCRFGCSRWRRRNRDHKPRSAIE